MTSFKLRRFCFGSFASFSAASALVACSAGEAPRNGTPGPGSTPSYSAPVTPATPGPNSVSPGAPTGSAGSTGSEGVPPAVVGPNGLGNGGAPTTPVVSTPVDPSIERLGTATMGGTGQSSERYQKAPVTRDGQNYFLMANGWGPGFESQAISWNGTSFTVETMSGSEGPRFEPASYPTVFCGLYSDSASGECGLPAALDSMSSLETGWSWRANGNETQEYNAAYDIWLGTSAERSSFSGYLMVWYREPAGQQPAGRLAIPRITVANVPGTWDIWTGEVGGRPIINWVRAEGDDIEDMEFDVLDFVRDAQMRNLPIPGTHVLSVAVGFEIWTGPINNLESLDFFVDVQ
jgi:glycosyl hydrolase family 12